MRILFLTLTFFFSFLFVKAQVPSEISKIIEKMKAGTELTESEERTLENWSREMETKYDNKNVQPKSNGTASGNKISNGIKIPSAPEVLNRESYIALSRSLMLTFGPKSGDLAGLDRLLSTTSKATEGSDYGALFMMEGAGAASVYTCAWSAVREPADILTANNLAIALKNEGEYTKALQILNYANSIKPNIALILANRGWIYFDAGNTDKATVEFNSALKSAPEMTSAFLGLGLIAQMEGNNLKAKEYLRKALKDRYSFAGAKAYKQAQQNANTENQTNDEPISDEKDNQVSNEAVRLPVYEQPKKMAPQEPALRNYLEKVNSKLSSVTKQMNALVQQIQKQQERAMQNPDNALVYRRDFSKEMMMLEDIELLLWGENSNYGQAVRQSTAQIDNSAAIMEQNSNVMLSYLEKNLELDNKLEPLNERMIACNGDETCAKIVKKEMDPFLAEKEQINYKICKLSKQQMDVFFSGGYKSLSTLKSKFEETVPDYYAFTNPVLQKIYAPTLNELYNLRIEAKILSEEIALASRALGLAEDASKYNELECIEPEPPESPDGEIVEESTPNKKPGPCPLGEDGLQAGVGAFSFELTCTYVKVSGGEGVLASVKRDFVKHETTLWAGVGAKAEYGNGNVTAEATIGAEITVGQNTVKDVAFTSSVKAGIGGLTETEISGRIAMEAGASIDMNTEFLP